DKPPTLVLSGINGGGNIAEDMTYSGTVAAAMEATLFGVPAIALSQDYKDGAISFSSAEAFCADTIRRIVNAVENWPNDTFFNVNFPPAAPGDVRGFAVTHQGKRVLGDNLMVGTDPRGRPFYWIGPAKPEGGATPGSDLCAMEENRVSITPIHLNLTNVPVVETLRQAFE
ncbi:MAG: 5'/3'-nucleotidase SurE, partial [Alphaproteobacteria bacterium]|nr:5'/3'-nucleotidase SurE [Alphaproteobacteria bacterium]